MESQNQSLAIHNLEDLYKVSSWLELSRSCASPHAERHKAKTVKLSRQMIEIYESGVTRFYDDSVNEEISEETQEEVYQILEMFRGLDNVGADLKFEGFDHNNDEDHVAVAKILAKTGRFDESNPRQNSHSSGSLSMYRRMLAAWTECISPHQPSKEDVERIRAARPYVKHSSHHH